MEGCNLSARVKFHSSPVHPGEEFGNRNLVWLEHVDQHPGLKNQVALHQKERFPDLLPGKPEGVDVIGCPVIGIDDVIDPHISSVLLQKLLDLITQVPDHHHQPLNPLCTQIADQPFKDGNASDLSETLRGIQSQWLQAGSRARSEQERCVYAARSDNG